MLRRKGEDPTYVAAFWTSDARLAAKIAVKANKADDLPHQGRGDGAHAAIAAEMKVHLTMQAASQS